MAVNSAMPIGTYLPDDAIDPALRDPAGNVHGSGRFSSSLVPAHFPQDEPHGQVDLDGGHGAHSGALGRQALRPRKSNTQYAPSSDMDANSRAKARRMENYPNPRHEDSVLNVHRSAQPTNRQNHQPPSFNRNLYPGYDEHGRRRGMDHLYGSQAPSHGDYYRPNTHEYSAGPSPVQMQPFQQAMYNHQPAIADGEYHQAHYPYYVPQNAPLHDLALMSQSQSTENTFAVTQMPVRRERTLHDLFGLDAGVQISLDGLKDPPAGQKPEYTYPTLMKVAIWSSPRKMLTLQEIYDALERRFPYFKECSNPNSWKTSIRHSLSLIAIFQKKPRPATDPGKGSYWTLDLTKGEGNKRERKRNKKPPKSKAKAAAAKGKGGGNSRTEQPSSTIDDEEEMSETDEDVCIDPALIHQPTPGPAGQAHELQQMQQHAGTSASTSSAGLGQPSAKKARTDGYPYPQSRSRMQEAADRDRDSENDSNTNSSFGRSATSTPFDDAFDGANAGVNNIVSGMHNMNNVVASAASTSAIRPVGRQLPAVPGYFPGPMPTSLNDFGLSYGIGGGTGMSMSTPGGGRNAVQVHSANANNIAPPPPQSNTILPNIPEYRRPQQGFAVPLAQGTNKNSSARTSQPSRTASTSAAGGVGFAAHAARAVSFSSAATSSNSNSGAPLPFGQTRDDIEIVQVGGGLPVARRISNARATRRMGNN